MPLHTALLRNSLTEKHLHSVIAPWTEALTSGDETAWRHLTAALPQAIQKRYGKDSGNWLHVYSKNPVQNSV